MTWPLAFMIVGVVWGICAAAVILAINESGKENDDGKTPVEDS